MSARCRKSKRKPFKLIALDNDAITAIKWSIFTINKRNMEMAHRGVRSKRRHTANELALRRKPFQAQDDVCINNDKHSAAIGFEDKISQLKNTPTSRRSRLRNAISIEWSILKF